MLKKISRLKIPPTIPSHLEFIIPTNDVRDIESEEEKRARNRAQSLADKSYASKEAAHLEGLKKLKQKFNRTTVLVLKHVDAQINLDLHQFLKSDPIKKLEPKVKYNNSLREHFSEYWGPHSSLDVTKIKQELTEMQGDDPGWRKYLQNFNYFVGSLEQTMQRDANGAVIYGPAPILLGHHQHLHPHSSKLTSAESSSTRQRAEDYSPGRTLSFATRCIQEPVPAVLQPEPQREDLHGPLQRYPRPGHVRLGQCQVQHP